MYTNLSFFWGQRSTGEHLAIALWPKVKHLLPIIYWPKGTNPNQYGTNPERNEPRYRKERTLGGNDTRRGRHMASPRCEKMDGAPIFSERDYMP